MGYKDGVHFEPDKRHLVTATDGWKLSVREFLPDKNPIGTVICGHAMMVDGRTLCAPIRPSIAAALTAAGHRVLVPDLRGHGKSQPSVGRGGRWTYDDLVKDTGVYLQLAEQVGPGEPVSLLGHSLFGHTALAWLGCHPRAKLAAFVGLGANVWLRSCERSRWRWWTKLGVAAIATVIASRVGHLPVRRLRVGSADEPAEYWLPMWRWMLENRWMSEDGVDYQEGLSVIACPLLAVVSDRDRLLCHPDAGASFVERVVGAEVWRLGSDSRFSALPPSHMGLATDPKQWEVWDAIASWLASIHRQRW